MLRIGEIGRELDIKRVEDKGFEVRKSRSNTGE